MKDTRELRTRAIELLATGHTLRETDAIVAQEFGLRHNDSRLKRVVRSLDTGLKQLVRPGQYR